MKKSWFKRNWRNLLFLIITVISTWLFSDVLFRQAFFAKYGDILSTGAQMLIQLAFYMTMGIAQMVGLMYFLGGAKIKVVKPGRATQLTLEDYKGQPDLLITALEWLKTLQGHSTLTEMGGRPPGGVMLFGAPGTGKTYLCKCLAGSADVTIVYIDASQLISMWMGVGIIKVMRFFSKLHTIARRDGAVIGVIDELDSVGQRGGGMGLGMGGGGMFGGMMGMGIVNRLLVEMDGISDRMSLSRRLLAWVCGLRGKRLPPLDYYLMVIGMSNRPGAIDAALMREGRFDIVQFVEAPAREGRQEILQYYLDKVILTEEVDVEMLAMATSGLVPSALEAMVRVSACGRAARQDRMGITQGDLEWAILHRVFGEESSIAVRKEERKKTSYHEAGHTIVGLYELPDFLIRGVSCVPHTGGRQWRPSLGVTWLSPDVPEHAPSHDKIMAHIRMSFGGLAAERIAYAQNYVGVAADMQNLNRLVEVLYRTGYFTFRIVQPALPTAAGDAKPFSAPEPVEAQMEVLLDELYQETRRLLEEHWVEVVAIADALFDQGDLSYADVKRIVKEAKDNKEEGTNE